MFWWIVFVISVIIAYVKLYKPHQYWREQNVEYIKPVPIVGSMSGVVFRKQTAADCFNELYTLCKNRYVGTYSFLKPTLLIKDIDLIKQITIKDFDYFQDHHIIVTEDQEPLFGKNLFSLTGQKWRHMRTTLSPAFTGSKMRAMYVLISDCAEQFTNYFMKHTNPDEVMDVEMKDIFTRFTNDAIASCAFGINCDSLEEQNHEFYMMGKNVSSFSGIRMLKFFGYIICPWLMDFFNLKFLNKKENEFFMNLVRSNIAMREKEGIIRPDMIHLLMEARKGKLKHETRECDDAGFATADDTGVAHENVNLELTDEVVTAQALIFFVAGFETSSTVMSFMAHELAVHEDIQRKLQAEIDATFEKCKGKLGYEELVRMKYLDMVVSETLRLWPPALASDRVCTKAYTIEPANSHEVPVHIRQGDVVSFVIYGMHRDPSYFSDPDKFDPERFSDERKHEIKPFTYLPFGIGPRNCIGSRFALLEIKALFAHLLWKFDIVVTKKTSVPVKLRKDSLNLAVKGGFWLGLKQRIKIE